MEQIYKFTYDRIPHTKNPNLSFLLILKIGASIFMPMLDHRLEEKLVSTAEQILMTWLSFIIRGTMQTIGIRLNEDAVKQITSSL